MLILEERGMTKKEQARLTKLFKVEVVDLGGEVDPDDEEDWKSLTLGWVLAKGVSPAEARDFASYIRYETDLG